MEPKKILVVDDDEGIRIVLSQHLKESFDGEVKTASDGQRAVDLILDDVFDLVITDFQMPEMNGLELFQLLSCLSNGKARVLIMTGEIRQLNKEMKKHEKHGCPVPSQDCILEKPFSLDVLERQVERLLGQQG